MIFGKWDERAARVHEARSASSQPPAAPATGTDGSSPDLKKPAPLVERQPD
jgi:hypothetical protein